jgi:hypothetical protein
MPAEDELTASERRALDALPDGAPVPPGLADRVVGALRARGLVMGFFLIRARDHAQAEAIARDCPHLRHGGGVAVHEVDPT